MRDKKKKDVCHYSESLRSNGEGGGWGGNQQNQSEVNNQKYILEMTSFKATLFTEGSRRDSEKVNNLFW